MSKLLRWPLAAVLMVPVFAIVVVCLWLNAVLWLAWMVRHPRRIQEDGYNESVADWAVSKPDDYWLWVASERYEKLIRKILKM